VIARSDLPVRRAGRRWAAAAVAPGAGCPIVWAAGAGAAAVLRQRYATAAGWNRGLDRCYGRALARTYLPAELVVVGSVDVFRNDRADEHRNAEFAAALLAERDRVLWLDLHEPEPPPEGATRPPDVPAYDDGAGDGRTGSDRGGDGSSSGGSGDGQGSDGEPRAGAPDNPLARAFPVWLWAVLAMLALAALMLALWRGRRLGPAVSEPLPVRVRSAETVVGRGHLYRRAKARGPVAETLRHAARTRLAQLLSLPSDAPHDDVVAAVSAHAARPAEPVAELLYGDEPVDDEALLALAHDLDDLTAAVADPMIDSTERGEIR
jgi:hypothetical protein